MSKRFGRNQKRKLQQKVIDQQKEFDRGKFVMQREIAQLQNTILGMGRELDTILKRMDPKGAIKPVIDQRGVDRAIGSLTYNRQTIERWMDFTTMSVDILGGQYAKERFALEIAKQLVESMSRG